MLPSVALLIFLPASVAFSSDRPKRHVLSAEEEERLRQAEQQMPLTQEEILYNSRIPHTFESPWRRQCRPTSSNFLVKFFQRSEYWCDQCQREEEFECDRCECTDWKHKDEWWNNGGTNRAEVDKEAVPDGEKSTQCTNAPSYIGQPVDEWIGDCRFPDASDAPLDEHLLQTATNLVHHIDSMTTTPPLRLEELSGIQTRLIAAIGFSNQVKMGGVSRSCTARLDNLRLLSMTDQLQLGRQAYIVANVCEKCEKESEMAFRWCWLFCNCYAR